MFDVIQVLGGDWLAVLFLYFRGKFLLTKPFRPPCFGNKGSERFHSLHTNTIR